MSVRATGVLERTYRRNVAVEHNDVFVSKIAQLYCSRKSEDPGTDNNNTIIPGHGIAGAE
jgi:hypothetical protein